VQAGAGQVVTVDVVRDAREHVADEVTDQRHVLLDDVPPAPVDLGPAAVELAAQPADQPCLALAIGGEDHRAGVRQRLERAQLAAYRPDLAEPGAEQLAERACRVRRLLGQPADAPARAGADRAAIGPVDAREQPHERRLADAVGADEAGALAVAEHERQPVEQRCAVVCLREI
jgi:hypothetical protein